MIHNAKTRLKQVTTMKGILLLIQFISGLPLMGIIFRTVAYQDNTLYFGKSNDSRLMDPKSLDYLKGYGRGQLEGTGSDIVDLLDNSSSTAPVCRKPLMNLWTRSTNVSFDNISFPSCPALLTAIRNGTRRAQHRLFNKLARWKIPFAHSHNSILDMMRNCDELKKNIDFPDQPASKEEAEYPLAYVFVPYRNLAQTLRLFRMIYQPQNVYCINYDTKSQLYYKEAIMSMASCFPNVFLNPNPEPIYYAKFSVLHSVMECVNVLRKSDVKWRYLQVVSWNDFPMKTNWEMVRIFKTLNGSQDCELIENEQPNFVTYEAAAKPFKHNGVRRPVPPGGITLYKGSFATSMSREFVQWMFTDPLSVKFYDYFNNRSICAEEFYWTSLIHNVHMNPPGGFPGQCFTFFDNARQRKPFLSRFQVWSFRLKPDRSCRGKYTHSSCVYGIRDLPMLIKRMEIFAHKLYEEFQPALLYCLEEWYWDRVCQGDTGLDMFHYQNLPSVRYHNLPDEQKDKYVCTL